MPYRPRRTPQLVAHRGVGSAGPQNSIPAIAAAADSGVDMVEMDVSVSADGDAVVIHGPRLEHSTTGKGRVRRHPTDVLLGLWLLDHDGTPSSEHRVPHLDDALSALPAEVAINLDLKDRRATQSAIETIRRFGFEDRSVLSGLTARHARAVRSEHPDIAVLCNLTRVDKVIVRSARLRAPWIRIRYRRVLGSVALALNLNHRWVDPGLVRCVHAIGAQVWVFTVNDPDRVAALAGMRVDSITTDHPERIDVDVSD